MIKTTIFFDLEGGKLRKVNLKAYEHSFGTPRVVLSTYFRGAVSASRNRITLGFHRVGFVIFPFLVVSIKHRMMSVGYGVMG